MTSTLLPQINCMGTDIVLNFAHSMQCRLHFSKTAKKTQLVELYNNVFRTQTSIIFYLWVV